ncbi:MAG: hypothetical protein PHP51_05990 [Desulfotomaculaceae bacterium]|nr:hypothetical protein [Desulfotomaculaceae bacterium]MDD4767864.1 hypothetical protein [Desulfotomaculaceae bacterium]
MRRFTVITPDCAREYTSAWEDISFKLVESGTWDDPEQKPDVFLWQWSKENLPVREILSLFPKLLVIISSCDENITFPEELSEIYSLQSFAGADTGFTIGSRLQGQVAVPKWDLYNCQGSITREEQIKVAAASIYRYLLEDVIQETAEWCGHMSSVVGHM